MAMDRRNFFASLFSIEPPHSEESRLFFGAQFVVATLSDTQTPRRARELLAEFPAVRTPEEKHEFYKRLCALLADQIQHLEYGYWDYLTDTTEATQEFWQWLQDLQDNIATDDRAMNTGDFAALETERINTDRYYLVVTMCFLLEDAPELAGVFATLDAIEEKNYWTHEGFLQLLAAVLHVDFRFCERDAVYVMPGNDDDGFSWEDVHGAGWEYLNPIASSSSLNL
jgi:hypothetical protein